MNEKEAFIALNLLPKVGPVRIGKLLRGLGSPQSVLTASTSALRAHDGIGPDCAAVIQDWENQIDLSRELSDIDEHKVGVLTQSDEAYPDALRRIHAPPLVLYVLGDVIDRNRHAIGVVGSRRATHYGLSMAKKFSFQLAGAGVTVVSGLARGIDTAAHEAAIAAKGRTIAVIGSGLTHIYPPENAALVELISKGHGAVVSEFPMRYKPDKQSFPQRNRIIAGWGQGILVVEAPGRSGALITANQAVEQDRTVYAIPGPVDRASSHGCNRLIQQGAKLVMDGADIVDDMLTFGGDFTAPSQPSPSPASTSESQPDASPPLTAEESKVLGAVTLDETPMDAIVEGCGLPPGEAAVILMRLQMKGAVKQLSGGYYARIR